ncbi:MAG: hypothetical protein MZV65_35345 [Chromatiales bacterium]|nr:hypothetical protein [Chromatiales bacterium]
MGVLHHAFTGTGAVALAVASVLPGTLVYELLGGRLTSGEVVRIGHAAGAMVRSVPRSWRKTVAGGRRKLRRGAVPGV